MIQAKLFLPTTGGTNGIKIPVGIHSGTVVFQSVVQETGWTDIIYAEPSSGRTIYKRLFEPSGTNPLEGETIQDAKNREIKRNLGHVVQAMAAVLGDSVVESFSASDYTEFISKAAAALNSNKAVRVNLKVVPDYKEKKYPDLPSYGTYVERHVEGRETGLKFSNKEMTAISDMERERAASSAASGALSDDDLTSVV